MVQAAQRITEESIGRYGYELLTVRNVGDVSMNAARAMRMLGIDTNNMTGKDVRLAQNRLLDAMQATLEAAGRPEELLRAGDLGEAGRRLSGHTSLETLRAIFTENTSKNDLFYFDQTSDGKLTAHAANARFPERAQGMLALTKTEIASQLMTTFDSKVGFETLHEVITAAKSSNAWHIDKGLAYEADFAVNSAVDHKKLTDFGKHDELDLHKLDPMHADRMKRLGIIGTGIGLFAAAVEASASEGDLAEKAEVFTKAAVEALPGVTYVEKMQAGEYERAQLDAASYLPSGLLTAVGLVREPEVQAQIDALPKDEKQLQRLQADITAPAIDRHMAEMQLRVNEAIQQGETARYVSASSRLTDLAEQKVTLQQEWRKNAEIFKQAADNPNTNWSALVKQFPDLTAPVAVHLAVAKENHSPAFLSQFDHHLTQNIEKGVPIQVGLMQSSTTEVAAAPSMQAHF